MKPEGSHLAYEASRTYISLEEDFWREKEICNPSVFNQKVDC